MPTSYSRTNTSHPLVNLTKHICMNTMGFLHSASDFMIREEPFMDMYGNFAVTASPATGYTIHHVSVDAPRIIGKTQTYLQFIKEHEDSFSRTSKSHIIQGFKQPISMVKTVGSPPSALPSWISGLTSDWFIVFDNADSECNAQVINDFIPSGRTQKSILIIRMESFSLCVDEMDDEAIHLSLKCGKLESAIGGHSGPVNNIVHWHTFGLHPLALRLAIINQVEGTYIHWVNKCTAEYLELHYQGTSGRKEIKGADVNAQGGYVGNALQTASHHDCGHQEIIELLPERGADHMDAQGGHLTQSHGNALQAASHKNHKEIVQVLLERGAALNVQGGFYGNALQAASHENHKKSEIIQVLLERGADVNVQGGLYGNALQAASYNGHVEVVRHLLDKGEDENVQEGLYGNAKLQVASSDGHTKILRPLLDKSAAVYTWDGEYGNALEGALLYIGHVEIASLQLLDKGEDVNAQERLYGTLQTSLSEGHVKVVQLLKLNRGADVNDSFGKALHVASHNSHMIEIVRLPLDNEADVNVEGGHYASPLQAGSFSGHIEDVKLLLERGAYVNLADGLFDSAFPLIKEECNGMYTIHPLMHMWSRNRLSKTSVENYGLKARALIIASMYRNQGRLDEAEMLEVDIMNARKAKLGSDHLDTLTSMANLALTYSNQGRWDEAERLEVDIINAKKAKLGSDHLGTLTSMENLALTYSNQGRWDEAEKLEVDIMNAKKAKLGSNHLGTLTSMANLAFTYSNQGRWDEAEKLQVDVMNASKAKLGSDHPDTLTSTANLAFSYQSMGMWTEAEKLQMEITEARILRVGEEHLDVLVSKNNLARIYYLQGKFEEAELLQGHLAKIAGDKFGGKDPLSLAFRSDLASTLSMLGRLDEAEELERHLLENAKGLYGKDHPYTAVFACNLAGTLLKQKKLEEAEELAVHGLKIGRAIFDPDHMDEAHILMSILGLVYHELGKLDEAEKLQVSIVESSKQSNMGGHGGIRLMDGLISMNNLVLTYQKQGKWEEAEKLQLQVVETSKSKLGPDHPDTLSMMENLLMTYWQQKKLSQSKSLATHIMEAKTTKLGPEHPESLWAIFNLGMVYQNMGNIYHAEKLVAHALKGMKKQLGDEHPDTQQMIKAKIRLLIQLVMVDVIDIFKTICKLESFQVFICYYILTWLFG